MSAPTAAIEVTAAQAWYLAEHLNAGAFHWSLAITMPYIDPGERGQFNTDTAAALRAQGVIDEQGRVHPCAAECIRLLCRARQWLEWVTVADPDDPDRILRAVLVRGEARAVVALRYAQMVTITPMQVDYPEALVPIVTAGLDEQPPARFSEFSLPMDLGAQLDKRIAGGADIAETLAELGVGERQAELMELARSGPRALVEITAGEITEHGARRQTDVAVNVINTAVGRILVSPPAEEPRAGGVSVFAPGDRFAIAVALCELTARLPSGSWFPDQSFDI